MDPLVETYVGILTAGMEDRILHMLSLKNGPIEVFFRLSEKDGFELACSKDVDLHFGLLMLLIEHLQATHTRMNWDVMKRALLALDDELKAKGMSGSLSSARSTRKGRDLWAALERDSLSVLAVLVLLALAILPTAARI